MRVSGLISNLDWEALVDQLLAIDRRSVQALEDRVGAVESLQSTWASIDGLGESLRTAAGAITASDFFQQYKVTSSDPEAVTASASSNAVAGSYEVVVNDLAQAHSVASDAFAGGVGFSGAFTLSGDGGTTSVNIDVAGTDTVGDLANKINDAYDAQKAADPDFVGVRATVIDNRLVLTRSETGNTAIVAADGGTTLLEDLGITQAGSSDGTFKTILRVGQDADLTINGLGVTSSTNAVTAAQGLTIDLLKADPLKTITLTVATDEAAMEEKITAFVDTYNKLADQLAKVTGKDGILQGEATARSLQNGIRRALLDRYDVGGVLRSLSEVGFDTDGSTGQVTFDAAAFWEAYDNDPSGVEELLDDALTGLDAFVKGYVDSDGTIEAKSDSYAERIDSLEDSIVRMEARLESRRQVLLNQFIAMEQTLSRLNAQGGWLSMQFNQLS